MPLVDIPDDWQPTAEAINALPQGLRDYIHSLETLSDPQFVLQQLYECRRQVAAVNAMLEDRRE